MNTLYHYGDSYATTGKELAKHFAQLLSEKLGYRYGQHGVGGSCNEQILNEFLKNTYNYKSGDVILFNFSFFCRGAYYDREHKKVMSGNYIVNDMFQKISKEGIQGREYVTGVLTYQLENTEDYNRKIFSLFDTVFELLINKGVKIFYIFIRESDYSNDLLKYGTHIKFSPDFYQWLHDKGFHNHEDCHYTRNIQGAIMNYIIQSTPELYNLCNPKLI